MADLDIDALEKLAAAATPGPWSVYSDEGPTKRGRWTHSVCRHEGFREQDHDCVATVTCESEAAYPHDAAFIAAIRTAAPAFIAEVRRLQNVEAAHLRLVDAVRANAEAGDWVTWTRVVELGRALADSPMLPVAKQIATARAEVWEACAKIAHDVAREAHNGDDRSGHDSADWIEQQIRARGGV